LIGPRHPFAAEWQRTLSAFEIDLKCDGRLVDRGRAANVLGGPLSALRHLVGLLATDRSTRRSRPARSSAPAR
jgi:2-oxo-3-hexenedioate decarboxylase